jgi:chemotaxis protein CheX
MGGPTAGRDPSRTSAGGDKDLATMGKRGLAGKKPALRAEKGSTVSEKSRRKRKDRQGMSGRQITAAFSGTATEVARFEEFLDRATDEVFSTMLGGGCTPTEPGPSMEHGTISAVIGLAGAMSGSLVLHVGNGVALRISERMTGIESGEVDAMVRDAVGEVCNMIAGAWKGQDPELASGCLLSTPTVVAGTSYELFSQRASIRIERRYRFEDLTFTITIFRELPG